MAASRDDVCISWCTKDVDVALRLLYNGLCRSSFHVCSLCALRRCTMSNVSLCFMFSHHLYAFLWCYVEFSMSYAALCFRPVLSII
jgi:hypothetical protein